MKKVTVLFLAFVLIFVCLGGCVNNEEEKSTTTASDTTKETTTEEITTEVTTIKETTTRIEKTTENKTTETTTRKPVSTTAKPTTTVPETEGKITIDVSDLICDEIDPEKPMIALTFDDGPSVHTPRLLNIFKKHGGKGTFFVVGNLLDNNKLTAKRIVKEGHEIASHSWSHPDMSKISLEKVRDEMAQTHQKIYDITGVEPKIIRPPYGAYNETVCYVAHTCKESVITWSVDTLDWKTRNADAVYRAVMNSAYDGAIILCHDLHGTTVDAMEKVIPDLIKRGYQLVTVSQLLTVKGIEMEAGKVYYRG